MRKLVLILLLLCSSPAFHIFAQSIDEKIEEIRRIYKQTNEQIAAAERNFAESNIYLSELIVNKGGTMYPAVGNFKSTIRFYYAFGNREENPYPNRLLKITVLTDRAAHNESYEYLFDREGNLLFYLEKTGEEARPESRFYFSYNKAIRILRGQKIADPNSPQERAAVKAVLAQAGKLTGIFRNSLEN